MSFFHNLLLPSSGVVNVDGGNFDVQVKKNLVEKKSTAHKMRHVKMTRQVFVLEVLNCLLQSDDVPFPRDVFLDGTFFASPRSQIPAQNAEPPLLA